MSVEELEILRKKARNIDIIGAIISIVLALILYYFTGVIQFFIGCLVVGLIITYIVSFKPTKEFVSGFKNTFVLKSLQSIFSDLNYSPEKGMDESVIRNTRMMNMGDRYSSNDLIKAKYKNINVMQADVHIEEKHESTDSDGHTTTTWVTIFLGRWMVFDFNKSFKANIQVCQKKFRNSIISNWGSKLKFKKVLMEDEMFNKIFRTYAQEEHDAFYVLTPAMMEKLKKLSTSIKGHLLFCFVDNKLHVGIQNNKDSFEHGIFTKIDENKVIDEISKDIKLITDFIDELDLDNDLFRKGV